MTQPIEDTEQDLSHIHWSWPEAIAANPAGSLANADLALDYFAYSPFFDFKSNNSVLRTQRRVENPTYGHAQEKHELPAFRSGFEYIVAHALPPELFVIHRRDVADNGKRDRVSGVFFILNDRVYMSPTVFDVMSNRLRNATHLIAQTFNTLSVNHPPSNPRAANTWRSLPPSGATKPTASTTAAQARAAETDDIDMGSPSGPTAPSAGDPEAGPSAGSSGSQNTNKDAQASAQPDIFLYNALASTRSALSHLDELSGGPEPRATPADELKAIEAALLLGTPSSSVVKPMINQPGGRGPAGPGSSTGRSARLGMSPAVSAALGMRPAASPLAPMPARSLAGASPMSSVRPT